MLLIRILFATSLRIKMRRAQPLPTSSEFSHRDSQSNLSLHQLHSRPLPTEEDVALHTLAPSGNLSGNLFILRFLLSMTFIADEPVVVGVNTGVFWLRRRRESLTLSWRQRRSALMRRSGGNWRKRHSRDISAGHTVTVPSEQQGSFAVGTSSLSVT